MLIEVKVKVSRNIDNKIRKKTETFLLDKELFSEAEYAVTAALSEEQSSHMVESFDILILKQSQIKEVCNQFQGNNSFIATLRDIWLETDGTEKYLKYKVLLWADTLTEANSRVQQLARQGYDMLIESLKQVDYTYLEEESNQEENA